MIYLRFSLYHAIQKMLIKLRSEELVHQGSIPWGHALNASKCQDVLPLAKNSLVGLGPQPARIVQQFLAREVRMNDLSSLTRIFYS